MKLAPSKLFNYLITGFDCTAMWFSRFGVRALSIPDFDSCWIVDQSAPRQLVAVFGDCPQSQRSILARQILVLVSLTDDR
jgi:hypothetical protein